MDPNATLEELRALVALYENRPEGARDLRPDEVDRLCELISALDGWLCGGGFLPKAWGTRAVDTDPNMHPNVIAALLEASQPANPPVAPVPSRAAFLKVYCAKIATYGWAQDPAKLTRFMQQVEATLEGAGVLWEWNSLGAAEAFREIGCKGKLTLKALRALP